MMIPFPFTKRTNKKGSCFVKIDFSFKNYYYEKFIYNSFIFLHA